MRKTVTLVLAVLLLFTLAACRSANEEPLPMDTNEPSATDHIWSDSGSTLPLYAVKLPDSFAFDDYEAKSSVRETNPVDENFINALNAFAYESAANILSDTNGENGCFSPLSLYYALALAATGASGETQAQCLAALGVDDSQKLSTQCGNLYRLLYQDNDIVSLSLANSLWVDDAFSPKEPFVENAAEHFYAETYRANLATQEAADAMAQWINEHTNGKLAPKFEPNEQLLMSIINTIYYRDQWSDNFDVENTAPAPFHHANGAVADCDFMNRTFGNHGYLKGDDYAKTTLYLSDGYRMIFVLPDEGVSVQDMLCDANRLSAILNAQEDSYGEVEVSLPKFDNSSDLELSGALKAMGITEAFDDDADFSNITDEDCFISAVQHQCRVSVNEDGVEAAAYTAIMMCGTGLMTGTASITFDRPFLYTIMSNNGAVLFAGVCMNPAA